jgi:hypothetical protein
VGVLSSVRDLGECEKVGKISDVILTYINITLIFKWGAIIIRVCIRIGLDKRYRVAVIKALAATLCRQCKIERTYIKRTTKNEQNKHWQLFTKTTQNQIWELRICYTRNSTTICLEQAESLQPHGQYFQELSNRYWISMDSEIFSSNQH